MEELRDGRHMRGERRRKAILDEAIKLFGEKGFHASALRELASRVGISEAGLLHHFGSKAALLHRVLDYRDASQAAVRAAEEKAGMDFASTLRSQVQRNSTNPGIVGLHVSVSAEATNPAHPAHDAMVERYERVRTQDLNQFEALVESSENLQGVDPKSLGVLTAAVMDGLQLQWLLDPEAVDMPAVFDDYLRLINLHENPDPSRRKQYESQSRPDNNGRQPNP